MTNDNLHLIVQQAVDGSAASCLLACDGKIVEAGGSIVEGIDFLFKFMWIFLLKYKPELTSFFQFLQFAVYKISYGKERVPCTVVEALKQLHLS